MKAAYGFSAGRRHLLQHFGLMWKLPASPNPRKLGEKLDFQ
jgi:hypothetical protein